MVLKEFSESRGAYYEIGFCVRILTYNIIEYKLSSYTVNHNYNKN